MSQDQIRRLDDQGMAAWDNHDAEAFVDLFSDDFVWHDWTLPEPIRDKDGARQYFQGWVRAFPDMHVTTASRVIGDDAVASEIEWEGTNSGPLRMGDSDLPPTNKKIRGRGSYIARVKTARSSSSVPTPMWPA